MARVTTFADRYRVKERIGLGGMAEVYLALATGAAGFEREVVLKRLLPNLAADPHFAAAFLDEARLLAKLHHPHIAQVFDVGEGAEGCYLVMEHIRGRDLREVMEKRRGPIAPGLAALVVRDVAEALDHGFQLCDESGVPLKLIHRDVSLSNIMISLAGVVKLVDFGLAKALTSLDHEHTADGVVKGKWTYVAPEVLHGSPADHRSDIFSTGVVLFELCVGRKLYKVTNVLDEVMADRQRPTPPPSSVNPAVPREIDLIVARALAPDPEDRFETAEQLADALDEVVHRARVRPAQLRALMEELYQPKRMQPTQQMRAMDVALAMTGSSVDSTLDEGAESETTDPNASIPDELRTDRKPPAPKELTPDGNSTQIAHDPRYVAAAPADRSDEGSTQIAHDARKSMVNPILSPIIAAPAPRRDRPSLPSMTSAPPAPTFVPPRPAATRPGWMLPAMVVTMLVVAAGAVYLLFQ